MHNLLLLVIFANNALLYIRLITIIKRLSCILNSNDPSVNCQVFFGLKTKSENKKERMAAPHVVTRYLVPLLVV